MSEPIDHMKIASQMLWRMGEEPLDQALEVRMSDGRTAREHLETREIPQPEG